jgi:hypothetical protein
MGLLTKASVAIDGSKFKAVNTRDKNFTKGKVERGGLSRCSRLGCGVIGSGPCHTG